MIRVSPSSNSKQHCFNMDAPDLLLFYESLVFMLLWLHVDVLFLRLCRSTTRCMNARGSPLVNFWTYDFLPPPLY